MFYWVIYDIKNNKNRLSVFEKCKNYGLLHVQMSVFVGELSKNKLEMLAEEIKSNINSDDFIFFLPTCENCYKSKIIFGTIDYEKLKDVQFRIFSGD